MKKSIDGIWCLVQPSRKVRENMRYQDYVSANLRYLDKMEAMRLKMSGEYDICDISDLIEDDEELEYLLSEEL